MTELRVGDDPTVDALLERVEAIAGELDVLKKRVDSGRRLHRREMRRYARLLVEFEEANEALTAARKAAGDA